MRKCFCVYVCLLAGTCGYAAVINVPADQPTIQAAINAALNGDKVMVASGTYFENIDFAGKAIMVTSTSGKNVTFIDGNHAGPVVTFKSGEGRKSVLSNFTLQNGSTTFEGGGIYISNSSPTITNNVVKNNAAANGGAGIAAEFSSALIQGNTITNNTQLPGYSGGSGGAGINVGGAGSAQIIGNVIQNNTWNSGDGGGITLFAAGTPTIKNNIIKGNVATGVSPAAQGGGIWIVNDSAALIEQNLIYGNTAGQGSGVYASVPYGDRGPLFVNNTIVGTASAPQGSAVYVGGFDNQVQFFNNLMTAPSGLNAVYCDNLYSQTPPIFTNNDAFSANGSGLQGTCASEAGQAGNISVDPLFAGATNFQLKTASPAIDAGTNAAPSLPTADLAGKSRIYDGNTDGLAVIDMGAYEYHAPI